MSNKNPVEGVLFQENGNAVPLVGVDVHGDIVGRGARVKVSQKFRNTEKKAIEAVYKFPLPENAAVCGFRALIDGRIVEGRIEEKEKAFEIYDKALADGHKAQLMDEERPNIFTLSVGNIKQDSTVIIEITYITLLDSHNSEARFSLPTTISPRYTPQSQKDEDGIPVSDIVNPLFEFEVPYGLRININVHDMKAISSIESPSHTINTRLNGEDYSITFSSDTAPMNKDFVLTIAYKKDFINRAFIFRDNDETFMQVDITPDETTETGKPGNLPQGREIVLLLDCSGSMEGDSIREAKQAMEIMIKALRPGMMFNIYRFGSNFQKLYTRSKSYNESSAREALQYLSETDASLGGTEILAPLEDICNKELSTGQHRDIILITDGEVSNEDEVMKLVKRNIDTTTLSTVGIGNGPNEFLIKGAARTSGGAFELIAPRERIEPKVLRLFQKVMAGSIGNFKVDCGVNIEQMPVHPIAYMQQRTSVFAKIEDSNPQGKSVKVTGNTRAGLREWIIDLEEINSQDLPISKLWAREKIRDIEESSEFLTGSRQHLRGEGKKYKNVVDISRKYGIISRSTSFVGVEKKSDAEETTSDMVLQVVPSCITEGWHGERNQFQNIIRYSAISIRKDSLGMPTFLRRERISDNLVCGKDFINLISAERDQLLDILPLQRAEGGFSMDKAIGDMLQISPSELQDISYGMYMNNHIEELRQNFHSALHNIVDDVFKKNSLSLQISMERSNADVLVKDILQKSDSTLRDIADKIFLTYQVDRMGILTTAIVLAILEFKFGNRRDEWDSVVSKSRNWLRNQITKAKPTLDGQPLEDWVMNFVKCRSK